MPPLFSATLLSMTPKQISNIGCSGVVWLYENQPSHYPFASLHPLSHSGAALHRRRGLSLIHCPIVRGGGIHCTPELNKGLSV